jgi:hypothetical protein
MRFNILGDFSHESEMDIVLDFLSKTKYRDFFFEREYSEVLKGITLILMCRDNEYNFKQRIRYSKIEQKLYIDLMFDNNQFVKLEQSERNEIVIEKILSDVVPIVKKYKFLNFKIDEFEKDLIKIFKGTSKNSKLLYTFPFWWNLKGVLSKYFKF